MEGCLTLTGLGFTESIPRNIKGEDLGIKNRKELLKSLCQLDSFAYELVVRSGEISGRFVETLSNLFPGWKSASEQLEQLRAEVIDMGVKLVYKTRLKRPEIRRLRQIVSALSEAMNDLRPLGPNP